jgi:GNAT superfamily N-acetyltransferase
MQARQKRTADQLGGVDVCTPGNARQKKLVCAENFAYVETTRENLDNVRMMVEQHRDESCTEKEENGCSEYGWWSDVGEHLKEEDMCLARFLIIVQKKDSQHLVGLIAYQCTGGKKICDYLYVHREYRKQGIASEMLKQSGIRYASALKEAEPFWKSWAERNDRKFQTSESWGKFEKWTVYD